MSEHELSNKELSSYLVEINSQEAAELPNDLLGNNAWINITFTSESEDTKYKNIELIKDVAKTARESRTNKSVARKLKNKAIIQNALNDKSIDLNATITIEQKKALIQHESSTYTDKMKSYEDFIKKSFLNFIMSHVPKYVSLCWKNYPEVMIPMEPFIYQASEDFGEGQTFNVDIDVPSYYSSSEIVDLMQSVSPNLLISIDRAIKKFFYYKDTRLKIENRLANYLVNVNTFYQMLKKNPELYETLINEIIKKDEAENI